MAQKGWIKKENIKWMLLFFLLAFVLRGYISTSYPQMEEVDRLTDFAEYTFRNIDLLEGKISFSTYPSGERLILPTTPITFIMLPLMLFFSIFGFNYFTATIISGCFISALTIIPLWMISEHLKINPKLTAFFYIFSTLDIFKILVTGSYSMSFGLLFFTLFILLILKKRYLLAPFAFFIPFFSHRTSPAFFIFFLAAVGLLSAAKYRKIFNIEAKKWILWSCAVIIVFSIIKFGVLDLNQGWTNHEKILMESSIDKQNIHSRIPFFSDYIQAISPYMLMLFAFGIIRFHKKNKNLLLITSWAYLPILFSFLPIFIDTNVSLRMAVYGAGSMALVAAYSFENFKEKHWIIKVLLIIFILLNIYYVVTVSIHAFYQNSIGVASIL